MINVGDEKRTESDEGSVKHCVDSDVNGAVSTSNSGACSVVDCGETKATQSVWFGASLFLLVACVLTGSYCCELNRRLYQHHQPFYDSLSYNEKLFRVMTISRDSGFVKSLETACFANNTNCLPFLIAAAIAPVVSPSRVVGIWIQTGLLYLFLLSLFYFLVRIKRVRARSALAGCLVFLGAKCLFLYNGGLSDFRMDLSLYLGFAMTCTWYLTSMSKPTKKHFLLLGVSASICCLFRATAPIYLVFALAPVCLVDLFSSKERKSKLVGLGLAVATVVLLAGWFFVVNFEFLKFYYVDWNTDANAKIPLAAAMQHLNLTRRSIGEPLILMIVCWLAAAFWHTFDSGKSTTPGQNAIANWLARALREREIDWRIAWIGMAPVVMMIARRAGLNPFVTMPCVFGLVLFFTLPVLKQIDRLKVRNLTVFCWAIMVICVGMAVSRGYVRHSPNKRFDTMAMNHQLIDTMLADAKERGREKVAFGVMHLTDLDSNTLYSTLLFDRADGTPELDGVTIGEIKIKRIATFAQPAKADWRILRGETDDEKIAGLILDANNRMGYLVLPDKETAVLLETIAAHNYINRYLVKLRERIVQDDSWVKVGPSVRTNEMETVEIYRKSRE